VALLPPRLSPWWLLLFIVTLVLWTTATLNGALPLLSRMTGTTWTALAVVWGATGLLALLAFLGLRATFAGAHIGLTIGLMWRVAFLNGSNDGWQEFLAAGGFVGISALGLGVGLMVDFVMFLRGDAAPPPDALFDEQLAEVEGIQGPGPISSDSRDLDRGGSS
jgi:hypothetical protein